MKKTGGRLKAEDICAENTPQDKYGVLLICQDCGIVGIHKKPRSYGEYIHAKDMVSLVPNKEFSEGQSCCFCGESWYVRPFQTNPIFEAYNNILNQITLYTPTL